MSEAAGFVKGALLGEELDWLWRKAGKRKCELVCGRAGLAMAITRIGRAVKAGRRPPVGEALTARSVAPGILVGQARQGLLVASARCWGWTRALVVSRSPRVVEGKQAELGCLVMSTPGPVAGSEHGVVRRSQQRSIT